MTKKISENIINQAIELYNQLNPLHVCAKHVGVNEETLRKHFKKHGVVMRKANKGGKAPNIIEDLPELHICDYYMGGESENSIANRFKVSRNVIRRILLKHGVQVRSQSQAESLKWSKMTNEQRANQVKKAHDAVTGKPKSDDAKRALAKTREVNIPDWYIGCGEPEFKEWLENEGIEYQYQKAVEFYNVDFLINGVAVELTSFVGRNRLSRDDFMRRAEILNDQGIKTLAVEFRNESELLSHAYDVINMVNKVKSNHFDAYYIAYRLQFNEPDIRVLA